MKCEIQWVNDKGEPTPDSNEAVCQVRLGKRVLQVVHGGVELPETQWWYCCADHATRLNRSGMEAWQRRELTEETTP